MLSELLAIIILFALLIILAKSRQPRRRPSFITVPCCPEIKPSKEHGKVWLRRNSLGFRDRKSDELDLLLKRERDHFIF